MKKFFYSLIAIPFLLSSCGGSQKNNNNNNNSGNDPVPPATDIATLDEKAKVLQGCKNMTATMELMEAPEGANYVIEQRQLENITYAEQAVYQNATFRTYLLYEYEPATDKLFCYRSSDKVTWNSQEITGQSKETYIQQMMSNPMGDTLYSLYAQATINEKGKTYHYEINESNMTGVFDYLFTLEKGELVISIRSDMTYSGNSHSVSEQKIFNFNKTVIDFNYK